MYRIKVIRPSTGTTKYYSEDGWWEYCKWEAQSLTAEEVFPLYQKLINVFKPGSYEVVVEKWRSNVPT